MCAAAAGIDVYPMTLEFNFRVPFTREWLLLHGVADASKAVRARPCASHALCSALHCSGVLPINWHAARLHA